MKFLLLILASSLSVVWADTPANCTLEEVKGFWLFDQSDPIFTRDINCDTMPEVTHQVKLKLEAPNIVIDSLGHKGTWTMIYNQGFEVTVNYRKYFAFSDYRKTENQVISLCNRTEIGFSHDALGNNWACIKGRKVASFEDLTPLMSTQKTHYIESLKKNKYTGTHLLWKPPTVSASEEVKRLARQLPEEFDWRNVNGVNYISPVTNQGCGDCYAHASVNALEARIRIATNNTEKPILSIQQIIDCSPYSQGCVGGFPYLVAGKYAQDFGLFEDECYPYAENQDHKYPCRQPKNESVKCKQRRFTYKYKYIGGYFGGCNEELMLHELVNNGPIIVGFNATELDFNLKSVWSGCSNPNDPVNHAVILVGYGVDKKSKKKFWSAKNSWGTSFGTNGYFQIERGVDMCGIESLAVAVVPIP